MAGSTYDIPYSKYFALFLLCLSLACGAAGGTSDSEDEETGDTSYTVSGTIAGLNVGDTVTLQLNGADDIVISENGPFSFSVPLSNGNAYNVQVSTTSGVTCSAYDNFGSIGSQNINDIGVMCGTGQTLQVSVTGLTGTGLSFQNNGADDLAVAADGTASFALQVVEGAKYNVIVAASPTAPIQACTASGAIPSNGTMPVGGLAGPVAFTCSTDFYSVSGTISGLSGSGLKIRNNGADEQTITNGATSFTFPTTVANGLGYAVTVQTDPTNLSQTCSVSNGSGTIAGANVTGVAISCSTNPFTVGGNVTGLGGGESVTIQINGGNNQTISSNTSFTFPAMSDGSAYSVTVLSSPSGKGCTTTNGSGTLASGNVTNVAVPCQPCGTGGSSSFTVSWDASRAYGVNNASGGGHRIYWAATSGISKTTPNVVTVANSTSTTTGTVTGVIGGGCTYYVKVGAYSSINSTGGDLSAETSVTVN